MNAGQMFDLPVFLSIGMCCQILVLLEGKHRGKAAA